MLSMVVVLLLSVSATAGTIESGQSFAEDRDCLQNPRRVKACPHLLYRLIQLPDQTNAIVRCICVEDFRPFLQSPESEVAQVRQRMDRRQLEAELGMELEPILRILRRQD